MSHPEKIFDTNFLVQIASLITENKYHKVHQSKPEALDLSAQGRHGITLLHWAMVCRAVKDFDALLSQGADATQPDEDGDSAVHLAARAGDSDYIKLLLARDIKVDVQNPQTGKSPLFDAITSGRTENLRLLLNAKASVDVQDNFGSTPLHLAAGMGDNAAVIALLKQAKDDTVIDIKNKAGQTFTELAFVTPDSVLSTSGLEKRQEIRDVIKALRAQAAGMN